MIACNARCTVMNVLLQQNARRVRNKSSAKLKATACDSRRDATLNQQQLLLIEDVQTDQLRCANVTAADDARLENMPIAKSSGMVRTHPLSVLK